MPRPPASCWGVTCPSASGGEDKSASSGEGKSASSGEDKSASGDEVALVHGPIPLG